VSRLLVLITGTGRSGTSTMSGALHHLGLYVPGPYLGANPSNPKGFFESKWAINFHKRIATRAGIDDFDSRPAAWARAQEAVTPGLREELVDFLRAKSAEHDQVVVKDPRSVWVQGLWREAAEAAGLGIRYVSMLRHPAEVVGSRSEYYAQQADEDRRRHYEIISVARWVNSQLISERETRDQPRAFVKYVDLLEDWRPVAARLATDLGLSYEHEVRPGEHHPVDDFIDPSLRRLKVTWADLAIPRDLESLAEAVWTELETLDEAGGVAPEASARLDEHSVTYRRLLSDAAAISHDLLGEARADAKREGERETHDRLARREAGRHGGSVADRPVRDVSGRDLLREAGRRALRKVRRGM